MEAQIKSFGLLLTQKGLSKNSKREERKNLDQEEQKVADQPPENNELFDPRDFEDGVLGIHENYPSVLGAAPHRYKPKQVVKTQ